MFEPKGIEFEETVRRGTSDNFQILVVDDLFKTRE